MFSFSYFKKPLFFSFLAGSLVLGCSKPDDDDKDPVITAEEELYINEVYPASGEDWVELFNNNDSEKDISGYKIYDDAANKYVIPNGTSIAAKSFLIFICDDTGTGLHTNFKLNSTGETVFLENKEAELVDKLEFPALANGQSYGRYPDGSSSMKISGSATQGSSNGDSQAPAFTLVEREPLVPALDEAVTVHAEFVGNVSIAAVKLFYRVNNGAFTSVNMALSSGHYHGTIPALNATGKVDYYVEAESASGKKSLDPFDAPTDTHSYLLNTDPLPQLKINEFLAFNSTCCPDNNNGTAEYDDWIEIYNAGSSAVDIGGMYVSDDKTNPFKSKIPATNPSITTIQPGSFLIIWADENKSQGELHAGFKLSNTGEDVGLYYKDGRTIDEYTFGAQSENISWGRITNGGADWKSFNTPTPGQSNE
jgi:hypothetical protein